MANVRITTALRDEILRTFKEEAKTVFKAMAALEDEPHRGKAVGNVGGVVIKELKHKTHRFYCVTDGHTLKFGSQDELATLIIKFVAMSKKNDQEKAIRGVRELLERLGFDGL